MTYTNEQYDTTIIEIKEEDGINNFMELDDGIINDIIYNKNKISQYNEKTIYIIHYPEGQLSVSYGIISGIFEVEAERHNFYHKCPTRKGSSGSPVLNLKNKIIGIHKEVFDDKNYNQGTFLNYPIKEFINNNYKNQLIKPNKEINNNIINNNNLKNKGNDIIDSYNNKNENKNIKKEVPGKELSLNKTPKKEKINNIKKEIPKNIIKNEISELELNSNIKYKDINNQNIINNYGPEINEIIIEYNINNQDKIKIFGDEFVKNNKAKCHIILDGNKLELCQHIDLNAEQMKSKLLKLKLIDIKNITDMCGMFYECSSLNNIPDISK